MARRRTGTTVAGERSLRVDVECEFWRRAGVSVVVGATLSDAWARARVDWPDLAMSCDDGDEACVVEVGGRPVVLLAVGFDLATYVHEAVHVARSILESRGVPSSHENDEVFAHTVEWFVRATYDAASKWRPGAAADARGTVAP